MNIEELKQIKDTYDSAGFFMLYVDEVGFEPTIQARLMNDDIYTVNDFEEKFIKETYPETESVIADLKDFLKDLIKDMSNGILSAENKNIDEILEAFSELLKADKIAIHHLELQKFEKADLLKTLICRHYQLNDKENKTELNAFLNYINEKHKAYQKSVE